VKRWEGKLQIWSDCASTKVHIVVGYSSDDWRFKSFNPAPYKQRQTPNLSVVEL